MKYNYHEILESELESTSFKAGSVYFTTDSGKLFLDPVGGGVRKLIGGDFEKYSGNNSGGNVIQAEPAEEDIPKVFINGTIPTTKDDVLAEMQYVSKTESFFAYLKIKCQGSSSMSYPKKNFTVKLYSDEARETKLKKIFKDWGHESHKYVLKANYIDHSHARNIVCARLWDEVVSSRSDYDTLPEELRNSPRNGAVDGFPIKVYTNGTYQGIYTWNIGKDDWMVGMDEDNTNHVLLCGETNTDGVYSENACNFRALWSGTDEDDWSVEVGTNSDTLKNSLNALISCVMDTDDDTFASTIGSYLDVQSAIDYYLHMYVICGIDGLAKNMLIATYDGAKWICCAYDMDATIGITPQGGTDSVRADYVCPDEYKEQFSLLWERIVNCFHEDIKTRYAELRKTVYSFGNIVSKFERFMDVIGLDLFEEDATIYAIPSASTNNIKFIRNFVRDRLVYTDSMVPNLSYRIPATGLSLSMSTLVFESTDPVTIVATVTPADATDNVVWSSDNTTVAKVENGVVTPLANGTCTITAKCGSYSAECSVTVDSATMVNKISWEDGYYIAGSTGELGVCDGDSASNFVNLLGATKIFMFSCDGDPTISNGRLHYYDSNKQYLGYITLYQNKHEAGAIAVLENATYVRFYEKTNNRQTVCYVTDVYDGGFSVLDSSDFVASYVPSANGDVAASNIGYFDVSIPVSEGQLIYCYNAKNISYQGSNTVYLDSALYGFDDNGAFVDAIVHEESATNGWAAYMIPTGVASVKVGAHNTAKELISYKIL